MFDEERVNEENQEAEIESTEDLETENYVYENYEDEHYGNVQYSSKVEEDHVQDQIKKKRSFKGSFVSYVIVTVIASMLGGLSSFYLGPKVFKNIETRASGNNFSDRVSINTNDDINTVSAVVTKSIDSVVGITTTEVKQDLLFLREVEGVGSGVIVDSNGFILTNSHVVGGGNAKLTVLLGDGNQLPAQLVWNDPSLDLAIVKVEANNLPVATLGDSDAIKVGEIAVAIGNPLGMELQSSVTSGIISGLNRAVRVTNSDGSSIIMENLIQTDASINPGNSGGPLLNSKGEVVGINTIKTKTAEGLGFSIPINDIKPIIEEVIAGGNYKTVFLGISVRTVEDFQKRLGVELPAEKGLVLTQIAENSPAHLSGLHIGDILVKIDDYELESFDQLRRVLYKYNQGDMATLTIIRGNEELNIDIEFTQLRE